MSERIRRTGPKRVRGEVSADECRDPADLDRRSLSMAERLIMELRPFTHPNCAIRISVEVIDDPMRDAMARDYHREHHPFLSPADVGPFDRPTEVIAISSPTPDFFTAAIAEMTRQLVAGMGISADLLRPTEVDRVEKLLGPVPDVKCGRACAQVTTCTKLGRCVDREPPKPIVADRADPTTPLPHLSSRRRMK